MKNKAKWMTAVIAGSLAALSAGLAPVWNLAAHAMGNEAVTHGTDVITPAAAANEVTKIRADQGPGWQRSGIVLNLGWRGDYDDKNIESPLVIKQSEDSYVMFYRGQSYADNLGRVMRAVSRDGINWKKTGVVMTPSEAYEQDKIDPMSVMYEDGTYKMWYGGQAYGGCANYATSTDGINWTRYEGNPVLRKTSGSWDNEGAGGQHTVIRAGDRYLMYYKGYGKSAPGWTFYGLAESSDGIHWTKKGKAVTPDTSLGETTFFKNLYAFKVGDTYYILHTMAEYLSLFLVSSTDGKTWTHDGMAFQKGLSSNGMDMKWATSPCIIVDNGKIRMWYEGGDSQGRVRTLYAETSVDSLLNGAK